jgi:hypothetical protein
MPGFGENTRRILFDPDRNPKHAGLPYENHADWAGIRQALLGA